jgi:membrane-associated phospholipid phosphatase
VNKFFKENKILLFIYGSFLIFGAALLFYFGKAKIHLYINQYHTLFFDSFFVFTTKMGEGLVILLIGIYLAVFRSYKSALYLLTANGLAAIFAQILKRLVFDDISRPIVYFKDISSLYLVPGVDVHTQYSFPSGHTTAAFATWFSLALLSKKTVWKIIFLLTAFLVGYSRMYLSQHFFSDVYAGSLIGVTFSILLYHYFYQSQNNKLQKFNNRLINKFLK